MRFATIAVAFAGAVMAESTIYSTKYFTITSCAATVTDCPASSTQVHSSVYPVTTPYSNSTVTGSVKPTWVLTPSAAAACPTYSVKTISTSVTVVVPTVIYQTIAIPCPTTASPSTGFPTPSANGTVTKPPVATVTAGASNMGSSLFVAAAAGLAAIVFA